MGIHTISPDADYHQVRDDARRRIDADNLAGRDAFSATHERLLAEHVTESQRRGDPCVECGNPWPCWAISGILSPE